MRAESQLVDQIRALPLPPLPPQTTHPPPLAHPSSAPAPLLLLQPISSNPVILLHLIIRPCPHLRKCYFLANQFTLKKRSHLVGNRFLPSCAKRNRFFSVTSNPNCPFERKAFYKTNSTFGDGVRFLLQHSPPSQKMFFEAKSFNSNLNSWDVAKVSRAPVR